LLNILKGEERERFIEDVKPQLAALKKYNYSKQISAIDKILFTGPQPHHSIPSYDKPVSPEISKTLPLSIHSNVPTPVLTMEQNSPQSSSLSSTNVSTVDDAATEPADVEKAAGEQLTPEIQIETA
jgi:mRNA-binding protein PUF3